MQKAAFAVSTRKRRSISARLEVAVVVKMGQFLTVTFVLTLIQMLRGTATINIYATLLVSQLTSQPPILVILTEVFFLGCGFSASLPLRFCNLRYSTMNRQRPVITVGEFETGIAASAIWWATIEPTHLLPPP